MGLIIGLGSRPRPMRYALLVTALLTSIGCGRSVVLGQETWELSRAPTLSIGVADGPGPTTFHDIRGVATPEPGMVAVADGGSKEIRIFSSAGGYLRSFGREGDGPEEFRRIAWIDMCGGQAIVAYDAHRFRVTKWTVDGELLDEFSVESPARDMPPYSVACGASGDFVVMAWPSAVGVTRDPGPYRPPVEIGIADQQGRQETYVGTFPGPERIRTEQNDRPHPFGKSTFIGIGSAGVYVGTADSFAVHLIDSSGRTKTFGRDGPVSPLTRHERELWIDSYLVRAPEEQRLSLKRQFMAHQWVPDIPPAYGDLRVDRLGYVWVSAYHFGDMGENGMVEWSVFGPEGASVATVLIPSTFRPSEIGRDYLLGVSEDDLGVQRVHRYGLTR